MTILLRLKFHVAEQQGQLSIHVGRPNESVGEGTSAQIIHSLFRVSWTAVLSVLFDFMCWWGIDHDSAATATSSTTANTDSHDCVVALDDHGGAIQHHQLDYDERNISYDFAADSAGRCFQRAPERSGRRDSDADDDLYDHCHWTERNSHC